MPQFALQSIGIGLARNGFELPSVAVSVVVISRCLDGYVVFRIAIVKRLCSLCGELNDVGLSEQARVGLDKAHTLVYTHIRAHAHIGVSFGVGHNIFVSSRVI